MQDNIIFMNTVKKNVSILNSGLDNIFCIEEKTLIKNKSALDLIYLNDDEVDEEILELVKQTKILPQSSFINL